MKPDTQWVAGGQIQGGRDYQEDAFAVSYLPPDQDPSGQGCLVLLLADGMGGHAGGAVASETVIQAFQEGFNQPTTGLAERFHAAVGAANEAVREEQQADLALGDMGTTLVVAVVIGAALYWVSVGDSPLWLCRDGRLHRLNADHSMRPLLLDLVELGRLTEEEALSDPRIHQLRSAIYGETIPLIDMNADGYVLEAEDLVLLASDGLETLPDAALAEVIEAGGSNSGTIVHALLDGVSAAGKPGQDNTTVVVYQVGRGDDSLFGPEVGAEISDQPTRYAQENQPAPPDESKYDTKGKEPEKRRGLLTAIMDVLSGNRAAQK